jgi:dihydroorotate dehydrogenase electron transfer subunit
MLKAVRDAVGQRGISAYVSMEENMACGIGACLGCVVKTVNGHKRVCKEGPVFPIEEIVW